MNVSYIGKHTIMCEMCSKHSTQAYMYDSTMLKRMFKEAQNSFKDMMICENCAKREAGKKRWPNVRRTKI